MRSCALPFIFFLASCLPLHAQTDICGNGIDDDNNGLTDCEDYSCYFSNNGTSCNCAPIDVVWMSTSSGKLYWVNHVTGTEHFIGQMATSMTDITWARGGKLYGVDFDENKIWEINPVTAQVSLVTSINGYNAANAMTSDAEGNLYLAARSMVDFTIWHILKINPGTGSISIIADLTPAGATSAGDLAFFENKLYLACTGDRLAEINTATGAVIVRPINGVLPGSHIYGIVAKANGTLYLGDLNHLYKLDLATMQASLYYSCSTPGMIIWGMAGFNDFCKAPGCNSPLVSLLNDKVICEGESVFLENNYKENGVSYLWNDLSVYPGLTVNKPGTYWLQVANGCGVARDTVLVYNRAEGCECDLYVANAFTPNNDGKNDLLRASSNCQVAGEISIYNRNGERVYYSRDLQKGWDGIFRGTKQPTGVFVYQVNYRLGTGNELLYKKGSFVLIR
jgi:gliding motility-associated-like protein